MTCGRNRHFGSHLVTCFAAPTGIKMDQNLVAGQIPFVRFIRCDQPVSKLALRRSDHWGRYTLRLVFVSEEYQLLASKYHLHHPRLKSCLFKQRSHHPFPNLKKVTKLLFSFSESNEQSSDLESQFDGCRQLPDTSAGSIHNAHNPSIWWRRIRRRSGV